MKNISAQSEGKRFENAFIKSVPDYVLVKRLNDNASAWSGGNNTRFSSNNECDYIMFDGRTRTFYGLELKTTKEKSLTFWREDFEDKTKKQTFQIRKCQIQGLEKWSKHFGVLVETPKCFSSCISIHSWRFFISCIHSRHRYLTFSYPKTPCEPKSFTLLSPFHILMDRTRKIRERVKGEKQAWVHTGALIVKGLCSDETSECNISV